jgi:adenylate cyclase
MNDIERELAYYKRQVDTLAGENLKLDYVISGLRHELKQKRQGFALLSLLNESIGAHTQISSIFAAALPVIGSTLGMDRAVMLTPSQREQCIRPAQWVGYRPEASTLLATVDFEVPLAVAAGTESLLVNGATPPDPLIESLRRAFELPYFVCVPVLVDGRPIAWLLSGRTRESKPLYPPLDQGDLDTFVAIAGLISASIRNMRVGVLEEMDRLKTQFFANISHEFRTPITLTLGPLEQLIQGRYGDVSRESQEQLLLIRRNQERLLTLVNQILDLAKFEAGEMRLRASRTPDVNRRVAQIAAQFESAAVERGVTVRQSLSPAASDADLYVDIDKFERVLINLMSNALKFTKSGHVAISTEIRDAGFRLVVSDTGIGIKDDQLPHIFDRFRQADGSESREYTGTGIGLAIVKEIVQLHGGDIVVSSRVGEGTTFRVTLPLGRAHLDPSAIADPDVESPRRILASEFHVTAEGASDCEGVDAANREAEASLEADRPTVLYAEDNAELRRHVRDILKRSYNVFLAVDGRDALAKIQRYTPDLIISDQMMPNMSGRDLLRAIRADANLRSTPVIFLTARAGTEARIESLEAGADDYLAKPFNEGELLARVRNLVRARAQERSLEELNRRLEARVEQQVAELLRNGELQRFVPRAVAERVLRGELGNQDQTERRKITVLCAGVFGLADLPDQLEPEELVALTNEYLREITAAAVSYGGTVDRVTLEGIVVLFGAPQEMSLPDQAWAGAQTAIIMRRRVRDLGSTWRRRGVSARPDLSVGLFTGFCTVGVFGGDVLRSYTAVGGPVSTAVLLQRDALPGKIVCGATTYGLLEDRVLATARGPRLLPGAVRPVESYELEDRPNPGGVVLPRHREFSFMPR